MLTSCTQLQNRLFHAVERTRTSTNCPKMKMHVQSVHNFCFSLSNMQICDVLVAVVVVVAQALYLRNDDVDGFKNATNPHIRELISSKGGNVDATWK